MQTKKNIIKILLIIIIAGALVLQSLYGPVYIEHESLLRKFIGVIN